MITMVSEPDKVTWNDIKGIRSLIQEQMSEHMDALDFYLDLAIKSENYEKISEIDSYKLAIIDLLEAI